MRNTAKNRDSNLELYRIIVMLLIVAHHYVVNSGLLPIMAADSQSLKSQLFYILGMWGKTGINCFVLITGYFMCTSQITLRKFLKLLFQIEFYKVTIFLIFLISGYEPFSIKVCVKNLLPVSSMSDGFTSCFIIFYLTIPFLNILIKGLSKKQHFLLILLSVSTYTFFGSVPFVKVSFNYVIWFSILYLISSYIRLYNFPIKKVSSWGWLSLVMVILSALSVLTLLKIGKAPFFFVADSNKIFALTTAFCSFMFFKDLKIPQNKLINIIASTTFGILLIHANSDTMRRWLWQDLLQNTVHYFSSYAFFYVIAGIIGVFTLCSFIDFARIKLIETHFFHFLDKEIEKFPTLRKFY